MANQNRRLINESSECAYCRMPATTRDHVVPRNLFDPPRPPDMITVACCSICNGKKGNTDEFLRDFLVCDADAISNEVADKIRVEKYQNAVSQNRSELWKQLKVSDQQPVTLNGIGAGFFVTMPFGDGPLKKSMTYMTRGIYYWLMGERIPDDHVFLVGGISDLQTLGMMYETMKRTGPVGSVKIGDNKVFSSFLQTYFEGDVLQASVWGFLFYQRTYIGCITVEPNLKNRMAPDLCVDF